jgi:hypothetical protein
MEVAQTNHPKLKQIPQEWMNRKSQPALEIILEYHHFIGMNSLVAEWQRWERGMRRRSYKALSPPFRIRGFLGNCSHDLRPYEFSGVA